MSWRLFFILVAAGFLLLVALIVIIYCVYKAYARYQMNKNRDYNVFREVELSKKEQRELSRWNLEIARFGNLVEVMPSEHDLFAVFAQELGSEIEMRTNKPFTVEYDFFRYFELEIIDKEEMFPIEIGITTYEDIEAAHDPRNDPYG